MAKRIRPSPRRRQAGICGALSNPHDRYGARIVWLAVFVVMLPAPAWRRVNRLGLPPDLA